MDCKKKKPAPEIVLIGTYPPPSGGVSIHIKALGHFLSEQGITCTYFNTGPTKDIVLPNLINISSLRDLLVKIVTSKASLFHVHGGVELYKKLAVFWTLRIVFNKRYIITLHSGGLIKDIQGRPYHQKKIIALFLNGAERIICVSQHIKNILTSSLGIADVKCPVVPAFAVNESLTGVKLPPELESFIRRHHPILSSVGFCFAPYYGFELAIKAVNFFRQQYPQIGLIIMGGDRSSDEFAKLKASFNEKKLQGVCFTGDIQHNPVLSVIRQSNLFLRPTFHDGDANSIREALAMQIPVIASDTEIRPSEAILFRKGDLPDLVDKISSCLANLGQDQRMEKPEQIRDTRNMEAVMEVYRSLMPHSKL